MLQEIHHLLFAAFISERDLPWQISVKASFLDRSRSQIEQMFDNLKRRPRSTSHVQGCVVVLVAHLGCLGICKQETTNRLHVCWEGPYEDRQRLFLTTSIRTGKNMRSSDSQHGQDRGIGLVLNRQIQWISVWFATSSIYQFLGLRAPYLLNGIDCFRSSTS